VIAYYLRRLFWKVTGGRPMMNQNLQIERHTFTVSTTGATKTVERISTWRDRFGRLWRARGAWSWRRERVVEEAADRFYEDVRAYPMQGELFWLDDNEPWVIE